MDVDMVTTSQQAALDDLFNIVDAEEKNDIDVQTGDYVQTGDGIQIGGDVQTGGNDAIGGDNLGGIDLPFV